MSTLADLRTDLAAAMRLADAEAKVHEQDPLTQFSRAVWKDRILAGDSVRTWYVERILPSVSPQIGADDWTARAVLVGLYSFADGMQASVENYCQHVARRVRAIPYCRAAEAAGVAVAVIDDNTHVVYRAQVEATFYALVTLS